MDLVVYIYKITEQFPKDEMYGLISQMRRAAVSIPSNIAEGRCRDTKKDFGHFLRVAYSSGAELETQIEIAKRLGYISSEDATDSDKCLLEVMKMLNTLTRSLKPNDL